MFCTLTLHRVFANSPKFGVQSAVVMVWACRHISIHHSWRCSVTMHMYIMDVWCSLVFSSASTLAQWYALHTYITEGVSQFSKFWTNICGDNGVSLQSFAHPSQLKVLKHLIYVWHGCGIHFQRRVCSLHHSVVSWFAHSHHLGFQPRSLPWHLYSCHHPPPPLIFINIPPTHLFVWTLIW